MKIQLWAYVPGSDDHVILADPLSLEAIFVMSDVGSMQLTYPLNTPHADLLSGMSGGNFVGCDVEVRVWNGSAWILPPQGRFEVTDYEDDFTSQRDMPTRTYTLQSWSARPLWSVRQGKITGLNDQGARDFINKSRGEIAGILIDEAQARGDVPNLTYLNSAGTGGDALSIPPGQTLQDILANARDEGVLEWLMVADASDQGRKLVCYSSLGTDLSDSVVLQDGLDIRQAPSHWSTQDMVQAVLVQGDDNAYVVSVSPDAASPYGKNMDFVTASGITDPTALDLIGQARLEKGKQPRVEHTRELIFDNARFLPFINYSLGDTILAPAISGEMQPLRVRQITLTLDSDGISGNLVLGDRFTERALQIERATRGIAAGAGSLGGSGTLPDNTGSQIDTALDAYDSVVQGIVQSKVHYSSSAPGAAPGNEDDTWFRTSGNKTVAIYKYKSGAWVQNPIDAASLSVEYLSALSADLGNVNAGTLTSVDITGSIITGGTFRTSSSYPRVEISSSSSGSISFIDSSGNGGALAVTTSGVQLQTPSASGFPGILALTENGFSVSMRGGTVLSFPAPQSSNNSSIASGGGLSITASGSLNLNGSAVNINGSAAVTGSVVRPGDGISTSSNVSAFRLITTSPRSSASSSPLYWNSANEVCLLSSSARFKVNIIDSPNPERVLELRPIQYNDINDPDGIPQLGLLAEEVVEIYPSLVSFDDEGLPRGVDYARGWVNLIPLVKELWEDYKERKHG